MIRFTKNVLYGLFHFYSPAGRDSRQTFCDIYKGLILLALFGLFVALWRNTLAMLYLKDFFVISDTAYWVLLVLFELFLLLTFVTAVVRRWQDLDIRIPPGESLQKLLCNTRFWQILATEEGSLQRNRHGDAPKDTPRPLVSDTDIPQQPKQTNVFDALDGIEEIK